MTLKCHSIAEARGLHGMTELLASQSDRVWVYTVMWLLHTQEEKKEGKNSAEI